MTTNVVDALEYITAKSTNIKKQGWNNIGFYMDELKQIETKELLKQIEDVLYVNKTYADPLFAIWKDAFDPAVKMPKLNENWKSAYSEKFPELSDVVQTATTSKDEKTVAAYVTVANTYYSMRTQNRMHPHCICNIAAPFIRKQLHKEGKTFITKDNINPIQQRMDAIVTAMNAYRLQGLDLALKNAGLDFCPSFEAALATENEVNEIKEDILCGNKDFSAYRDFLRLHLGVEKFNEFVDEYNNGKAK